MLYDSLEEAVLAQRQNSMKLEYPPCQCGCDIEENVLCSDARRLIKALPLYTNDDGVRSAHMVLAHWGYSQ